MGRDVGGHEQPVLSYKIKIAFCFTRYVTKSVTISTLLSFWIPQQVRNMSKSMPWDPAQLPDLTSFIAIVTGGNTGLYVRYQPFLHLASQADNGPQSGLATATELAFHHATVYIASRSAQKSEEAIAVLQERQPATAGKMHFLEMDLMDLESVTRGAERFLE